MAAYPTASDLMRNPEFRDYLPNLLPYRSIIISYVILMHILMHFVFTDPRFAGLAFAVHNSDLAVILLYILSGFLISYMLLKEKTRTNTIQIRSFYKRRFYRIYPVYIFLISVSYLVYLVPSWNHLTKMADSVNDYLTPGQEYLFLAFLGSHILFSLKENALSLHTWTVGAEENFYLIWAPLVKRIRGYNWILPCLLISPATEFTLNIIHAKWTSGWTFFLLNFNNYFRISTIAIGAIGCYLYLYKKESIVFCRNRWLQYAALFLLLFFFISGVRFGIFFYEFIGALFLILVLGNIEESGNPMPLEYKPLKFIGRISYGMYAFHPMCIMLSITLLNRVPGLQDSLLIYILAVTMLSYAITILVSIAVYYSFERRLYERSSTLLKN
jgi:peptidoglycan/LPS O-acetylase OafA/YrhL